MKSRNHQDANASADKETQWQQAFDEMRSALKENREPKAELFKDLTKSAGGK